LTVDCQKNKNSETDTGGQLTVDHFRPKSKGGNDSLDNLLYCCIRCNQYKLDYWPTKPDEPMLWNPRQEPADRHFLELDDDTLRPHPIPPAPLPLSKSFWRGEGGIKGGRGEVPLIAHRLHKHREAVYEVNC
jgi:hypothetical protein